MRNILLWILGVIALTAFIVCAVLFVTAIQAFELGRMLVYGVAGILCLELLLFAFLQIRKSKKA